MLNKLGKDKFKEIVKLENKKYRDLNNEYIVFGKHLIDEAIKYSTIKMIITCDENIYLEYENLCDVFMIEKNDIRKFKSMSSIPDLIGVCNMKLEAITGNKVIGINKVNNPGNLGTIIRTAKAFGINDIILDNDTVDIYNPKTIQSMQGVHFSMNIVKDNLFDYCVTSKKKIITTFLDIENESELITKEDKEDYILIFGNEATGIEKKYKDIYNKNYKLEIAYESLNVSIAAGIIIYEMLK